MDVTELKSQFTLQNNLRVGGHTGDCGDCGGVVYWLNKPQSPQQQQLHIYPPGEVNE